MSIHQHHIKFLNIIYIITTDYTCSILAKTLRLSLYFVNIYQERFNCINQLKQKVLK
ncbi:MAG: hypothetical protein JWQ25_979 [Daejeonella sp.]|nr:hypothetical protein [Daejeonella sp.]